ncbi:lactonase family protein [Apilactobacillus ozensis]|uniref:lactonase family protein n=1 Tax=Apilactobacillus ozensis TaxID=866801 RepID=UPI00200B106F|nr:lactonase family protein [Apilactobacillus ozensis]MCK8606745.1 lactonase family protein [Apilactobacillus ozensis]
MTEKFLIGTYTKKSSEGIYELSLDADKLSDLKLVAKVGNPTYVTQSNDNRIYAVDKDASGKGGAIALDGSQRPATEINKVIEENTNPAYITVDENRQLVYTANYHTGEVKVYHIGDDGELNFVDKVVHEGSVGPRPEQQNGAHPHYADLTPDNRLAVVDLGQDRVYIYDVTDNGKLTEVSRLDMEAGFGPRHIVFDADKQVAYLAGELSSKLAVLNYDADKGALSAKQTISTIPDDWTEHNGAAAIRISKDGKFIYLSNRGHNSLAVFESDDDANVKLIQLISTEGDFPRDFNFNGDESLVICLNQNTNNATLYSRNADNGKLTIIQKDFTVPEGVCVAPEK